MDSTPNLSPQADSSSSGAEPSPPPQDVVWILGMHRSGTSLTTRAISFLGYNLGPSEKMLPPEPGNNDEGFWEHAELTVLNEEILEVLGGGWATVPKEPICPDDSRLAGIRVRAQQIIEEDFGSSARWAWKDPRTCLTAPFWQPFAPQAKYVICLRSPQAVAASLAVRDNFSHARSFDLWFEYTRAAIENTDGRERLFVFYDDWLDNPDRQLDIVATFLGLSLSSDEYAADREAALQAIRGDLRHHQTDLLASIDDEELPVYTKALYLGLWGMRQEGVACAPSDMDRAITIVAKELAERNREIERGIELSAVHARNLTAATELAEARVTQLETDRDLAAVHIRNITAALESTEVRAAQLQAEWDLAAIHIRDVTAALESARERGAQLQGQAAMAAQELRELKAELDKVTTLAARRQSELDAGQRQISQLQLELERAQAGLVSRGLTYVRTVGVRAAILRTLQPWRWLR